MELSTGVKDLYQKLEAIRRTQVTDPNVQKIEVDEIASRLATLYEKIRNTIDYREDYLLRRFALQRSLRAKLMVNSLNPSMARGLVEDLIRGKYLPNNTIPEVVISDLEVIIEKYQYLFFLLNSKLKDYPKRKQYINWLIGIMACELDMKLVSEHENDALIEACFLHVKDRVKIRGQALSEREKNIQLYIVIHKDMVVSDTSIISYHLFNLYFPDWTKVTDKRLVEFVADKLPSIYHGIEQHIRYPHREKIKSALKKELAEFKLLKNIVFNTEVSLTELLSEPEQFQALALKSIKVMNQKIRTKINRASFRAIFYIFVTKMLLAFLLEYPFDILIEHRVNWVALGLNIIVPPTLMFIVALTVGIPGKNDLTAIVDGLMGFVYNKPETHTLIQLRGQTKRNSFLTAISYIFYIAVYAVVFGFIISWLHQLDFNFVSGGLFIFFVTVVSFFASRIRQQAKEFSILRRREGVIGFLIKFFSLPIIKIGQMLSSNISRINIFIFIFDFVLEAPVKLVVGLLENLAKIVKEQREDIYKE